MEAKMKYHISEKDASNAECLINEMTAYVGRNNCSEIKELLGNTDFEITQVRPEGYKYLWETCLRSINLLFQTGNYIETLLIIDRCTKFEGLYCEEKEALNKIRTDCEAIKDEKDKYRKVQLISSFYVQIGDDNKAVDVLNCLLQDNEIIGTRVEVEIRKQLDVLVSKIETDTCIEYENISRLVDIAPNDNDVFESLASKDLNNERIYKLVVEQLAEKDNEILWEAIIDSIIDPAMLVKIANTVGIKNLKNVKVLEQIIASYNYQGLASKGIEELNTLRNKPFWNVEYEYVLINAYIASNEFKVAEKMVDKILSCERTQRAIYIKGNILLLQRHYGAAIRYFNEISSSSFEKRRILELLYICHAALNHKLKAVQIFNTFCEGEIKKNLFSRIYRWIFFDMVPEEVLSLCLKNRRVANKSQRATWREFDYFFNQIFVDTNEIEDNGVLRVRLLKLHSYIKHIKVSLQVVPNPEESLFHYSGIQSIVHLTSFKSECASKFRLSNVASVNDPAEGSSFLAVLQDLCNSERIGKIFCQLYNDESLGYRRTYLSSFSNREDFLPLWVQYSNNGTGCCYKISTTNFGIRDNSLEKQVIVDSTYLQKQDNQKPSAYRVYYYKGQDNSDRTQNYCRSIGELLISLENYIDNDRVKAAVAGMLDEIRYLFKSRDYETESEVRAIMTDFDKSAQVLDSSSSDKAPKLYLELNTDLEFEEIILGPKVRNVREWAAYLGNCTNVDKVSKSKIQYE